MADLKQEYRLLEIDTPLGKDAILMIGFKGTEHISDIPVFEVELISPEVDITPESLLSQTVSISIASYRFFHGHVIELVKERGSARGLRVYSAKIVPWLWFLTLNVNTRIFQEKNSIQIAEEIFKDANFSDFSIKINDTPRTREYCVQYNESDYDFISRLFEEDGISFFFQYTKNKHTLVLTDNNNGYANIDPKKVPYSYTSIPYVNCISEWNHHHQHTTGKWSLTDYNYNTASQSLANSLSTILKVPSNNKLENYQYPGQFATKNDGKKQVKILMEADEATHHTIHGTCFEPSLCAGHIFELDSKDEIHKKDNGDYLLTSVEHIATDVTFIPDMERDPGYRNTFTCIPKKVPFRPLAKTEKPTMFGPQTAVVVGPKGEEIFTDDKYRIKVQFHWDRDGKKDENSSCWVRVSQAWAGKGWGAFFLPRIGHEVVVSFVNGDPDRPLVTGSVYNSDNPPPYKASDKTKTGFQSRSTPKGSAANFNEFRFDDKKGNEEIYLHAEKDYNFVVENDETGDVQNNQTLKVKNNRNITVTDGNESIKIAKGNHSLDVKQNSDFNAQKITMTAKTSLELKVGSSTIKMTPSGINIEGIQVTTKGKMNTVKGDAMVTVKGGITKIN